MPALGKGTTLVVPLKPINLTSVILRPAVGRRISRDASAFEGTFPAFHQNRDALDKALCSVDRRIEKIFFVCKPLILPAIHHGSGLRILTFEETCDRIEIINVEAVPIWYRMASCVLAGVS